ncbi:MAG: hypothetical protein ACO1G9_07860, partial [Bacteroidota bacterium]
MKPRNHPSQNVLGKPTLSEIPSTKHLFDGRPIDWYFFKKMLSNALLAVGEKAVRLITSEQCQRIVNADGRIEFDYPGDWELDIAAFNATYALQQVTCVNLRNIEQPTPENTAALTYARSIIIECTQQIKDFQDLLIKCNEIIDSLVTERLRFILAQDYHHPRARYEYLRDLGTDESQIQIQEMKARYINLQMKNTERFVDFWRESDTIRGSAKISDEQHRQNLFNYLPDILPRFFPERLRKTIEEAVTKKMTFEEAFEALKTIDDFQQAQMGMIG